MSTDSMMPFNYFIFCPHPTFIFSFPQSFPSSGYFPMSWFFASGGQSIGASAWASVLLMNNQGWFSLGLTGLILPLVAQIVKTLPAVWETQVWSTGQEDLLEKEMSTHSSILVWIIPWIEEPGRLQSMGRQSVRHSWVTNTFTLPIPLTL